MRLAFLGTPQAAVPSLRALVAADHDIVLVITRPDRRRGRGGALLASPVKVAAQEMGLHVAHRVADLDGVDAERGVVVAYGAMVSAAHLERVPMLNVHFSLLPRWRGAAPVQRAILAGDLFTGVSIMSLEAGLDTGPVHLAREVAIGSKTASELTDELADVGAAALVEVLASSELLAHPRAQEGEVTYAEKLTKETFHLTPDMDLGALLRTIRLEGAFTFLNGRRLRVLAAHQGPPRSAAVGSLTMSDGAIILTGAHGTLVLDRVQPEGSRAMDAHAWWSGARLATSSPTWS
ncbi:MAG: methionyl-tRNA formyltransferase [Acidimicrobiales bacterium]|jgi:methionyl-tRNA formyltransferase